MYILPFVCGYGRFWLALEIQGRKMTFRYVCILVCTYVCMHFRMLNFFWWENVIMWSALPSPPRHGWRLRRGFRPVSNQFQSGFKVIVPDTQKEQVRNVGKCIGERFRFPAMPHFFFPSSGHAASRSTLVASAPQLCRAMRLRLSHSSYNLCRCRTGLSKLSSGHFRFVAEGLHKSRIVCRQGHGQTKLHKACHGQTNVPHPAVS